MSDEIRIPIIDQKQSRVVDEYFGASCVLDTLQKAEKQFGVLPGYNSAIAVAESRVANMRVKMFVELTQTAAKAGVCLKTHRVSAVNGREVLCVPIPMDGDE